MNHLANLIKICNWLNKRCTCETVLIHIFLVNLSGSIKVSM